MTLCGDGVTREGAGNSPCHWLETLPLLPGLLPLPEGEGREVKLRAAEKLLHLKHPNSSWELGGLGVGKTTQISGKATDLWENHTDLWTLTPQQCSRGPAQSCSGTIHEVPLPL